MKEPKPKKAAIVSEVRDRLEGSQAVMLTEYRGLKVADMAKLRSSLRSAGTEYAIYKNRLVRVAATELQIDLDDLLKGPTAIAFVSPAGDFAAAAKVLRDFAQAEKMLVLKGGVLDKAIIGAEDVKALADLPSREVLLAQLAGAFVAPLSMMAGALQAIPRQFAGAIQALIDKNGSADESD